MVVIFLYSYIYVQWLLPCPVHPQSSQWVSAILEFEVSGYPKQHSDLMGNAGSLIHFSVNIFSFPLFPNLCVLSQTFWFVPLPSSAVTSLSELRLRPLKLISCQRCIPSPLFGPIPNPSSLCSVRQTPNCLLISLAQSSIEPVSTMF